MSRRKLLIAIVSSLLVLALALLPAAEATAQQITLKWAHPISKTAMNGEALEWVSNEIERRTGGAVRITHYWGGSLLAYGNILDGTRTGVTDIGSVFVDAHPSELPLANITTLPLAVGTPVDMARVQRAVYQIPAVKAELDKYNQFYWLPNIWPPITLCTKTPVQSTADLKGKRIRGYGNTIVFLGRLGAVPVTMSGDETYTALGRGTLDGAFAPTNNHLARKYDEVAPYMLMYALGVDLGGITTFNKDTWAKLSPEHQKVLQEVANEFIQIIADYARKTAEQDLIAMKQAGMTFTYVTEESRAHWQKEATKMWNGWVSEMQRKGRAQAKDVFDAYEKILVDNNIKVGEHKGLPGVKGGEAQ